MTDSPWVSTKAMADLLGVSIRTLHHYRLKGDFLIQDRHYRRTTPSKQAPWQWERELTTKAWQQEVAA